MTRGEAERRSADKPRQIVNMSSEAKSSPRIVSVMLKENFASFC